MSLLLSFAMMMNSTVVLPGVEGGPDLELQCEVGPVDREYGGSAFSIYSCDDGKSLVAVAKQGSKAFPFYFIVSPAGEDVLLYGQGDGDSQATRAAFSDLNAISPAEVAELVEATKAQRAG